eukprot:TRINITY_DN814_c1_g1_i5.p1 TRINITY_DN814_c1_g1~~TRINITY_DN814_c1_g1_i5.p1  ORF type:complete len:102 (-),score=30.79 TRINITY_DN814_c1_g1_i5:324-629(-)
MNVEGITRDHVSSHLQKYRLAKKKQEEDDQKPDVPELSFSKVSRRNMNKYKKTNKSPKKKRTPRKQKENKKFKYENRNSKFIMGKIDSNDTTKYQLSFIVN